MNKKYYKGQGNREITPLELPVIDHDALTKPQGYIATPELAAAVDTAITLGMPLLLTGEPGSGKSSVAKSIAWEVLGADEEPLQFIVKSDTRAKDLFYRFDTVGRFHASNSPEMDTDAHHFIHFEAIGKAILQAKPISIVKRLLQKNSYIEKVHTGKQKRNVVLIDEIDKAPRDVPNDILVEIEQLCFDIPELQANVSLSDNDLQYQPIVIFTSNSERALPEAFLRRCVYHHLQFPAFVNDENSNEVTINKIVESRLGNRYKGENELIDDSINWFKFLRNEVQGIERKPSLAEFLNWIEYLLITNSDKTKLNFESKSVIRSVNNILLKNPKDQQQSKEWLQRWKDHFHQ